MNKVSEEIIKLRKDNNLSQQDLADQVFVSRQAISKYERGECYPSIEVIEKIKELYNIDLTPSVNYDENKVIIADNQLKINNLIKINKKFKMTLISIVGLFSFLLVLVLFILISNTNRHSLIILDDYNQIKNLLIGDVRELNASYKGKTKEDIEKVSFYINDDTILILKDDNVIEAINKGEAEINVHLKLKGDPLTYHTSFVVNVSSSSPRTDLAFYDNFINDPVIDGSFGKAPSGHRNIAVGKKVDLNELLGCESSGTKIFLGYTLEPGSTDYITEYTPSIDHEKNVIYCNFMYDYPVITYDLNGGVNHPYNLEKLHSKGKDISFYAPTKEGYFFVRWIVVYKGEVRYYYGEYFSMIIEDDVTLIAEWKERKTND